MIPFGSKSVTLSMLIDLLTSRCRSTQVKLYTGLIASRSIVLWPQEMFTFSEMLALVQSGKQFRCLRFVFHRRPAGLQATSDLVRQAVLVQASPSLWWTFRKKPTSPSQISYRHPRISNQQHIHQFFPQFSEDVQVLFSKLFIFEQMTLRQEC